MRIVIERISPDAPALAPDEIEYMLDLFKNPDMQFKNEDHAYKLGFDFALTCLGYTIVDKDTERK
ncbi:hypothetical protein NQS41_10300 [Bacillus sp. C3(2022)]|uniref:hypothetical protein n=1 Tax=Bacillus TaxID=1386 RepID=UPI0003ED9E66|nr:MULTISPECIES: hypothetical protein [Bacillus]EWH19780.1 hypothetical protein M769_0125245 [Bacillus haynesii]TWJ94353.1 hypothetical protein CHCC20493_0513 [Bacillus licheniformis]TWL93705.1 hypothetical protein CHCC15292_4510 [Bacillus licheniformis]